MIEIIYSPVCEKLPLIRAAREHYGFELREINQWEMNDESLRTYPPYIQSAVQRFWNGEDGFYAWKIYQDGQDITHNFEQIYPLNFYSYPDLAWEGEVPAVDHRKLVVRELNLDLIDQKLVGPGVFCLGTLHAGRDLNEIQKQRRALYAEISKRLGFFGFEIELDGLVLGFILFMAKDDARRAGYYCSRDNTSLGQTLVISCLYIPGELRGEGLAGRLIAEVKRLAASWGFQRVEVAATQRYIDHEYTWWSKEPFVKAGFRLIEDREFADGYPQMGIWCWSVNT